MIENIVISSSAWKDEDINTLFGDENVHFSNAIEISQLLKEVGVYASTSQARRAGRHGSIPSGWTEYKASKKRVIWIWNPTE